MSYRYNPICNVRWGADQWLSSWLCFYCAHSLKLPWTWTYTSNVLVSKTKTSHPTFTYSHVAISVFSLTKTQNWNEIFGLRHTYEQVITEMLNLNILYFQHLRKAPITLTFSIVTDVGKNTLGNLYKCAQMPMGDQFLHYSDITIIYRWGIWRNIKIKLQINK